MLSHLIARLIILIFGTFYPAYACFKVLQAEDRSNYLKWMMYWIVFAIFTCIETITDLLIWWFPLYYEIKLVIAIGLILSLSHDSSTLYRHFACPLLKRRKPEIDDCINFVRWEGSLHLIRKTLYLTRHLSVGVFNSSIFNSSSVSRNISKVLFLYDSFMTQTSSVEIHTGDNETNKRVLASSQHMSSCEEKNIDQDRVLETVIKQTKLHTTPSECQRKGIIREELGEKKRMATAIGNLSKTSSKTSTANTNNYNNNDKNEQSSSNIDCIELYKNNITIEMNGYHCVSAKIGLFKKIGLKEIETEMDNGTHDKKETIKRVGTLNFGTDINVLKKLDTHQIINKDCVLLTDNSELNKNDTFVNKKLEKNMTITNTNSKVNANVKTIKTTNINSEVAKNLNSNTNVNLTSRETAATTISLTPSITKISDTANEKIKENITITNAEMIEAPRKNAEDDNLMIDSNVNVNIILKEAIRTKANVTLSNKKASDTLNEKIEENEKITNPNSKLNTNAETIKTANINEEFKNKLNPQFNIPSKETVTATTTNLVWTDTNNNKNDKIAEPPSSVMNTNTDINISIKEVSPIKVQNNNNNGNVIQPKPLKSSPSHGNTIESNNTGKVTTAPPLEKVQVNYGTHTINNNNNNNISQNIKTQPLKTTTNSGNMNPNNIRATQPTPPAQKSSVNSNTINNTNNNNKKVNQNVVKTPQPVKNITNSVNKNTNNNVSKPNPSTQKAQDNPNKSMSNKSNKCTNVNTPHSNRNNYPNSAIQKVQNRSNPRSRNTMISGPPEWTLRYYNSGRSTQSSNFCSPSSYCCSPTPTISGYSYWDRCGYY